MDTKRNSYILGISAYYHDSAACLFRNGQLVFACEEEKFSGIKHDSNFPIKTIQHIFKTFKIEKDDIEAVCYYEDPKLKLQRVKQNIKKQWFKNFEYSISSYWKIKTVIRKLNNLLPIFSNNVFYSKHHESHLYYAYFTSDFKESICISIDGVGEMDTASFGLATENTIEDFSISKYPHSLGLFYSAMTGFLGFQPNSGEYKVMGLAAYGNPKKYITKVRQLIEYKNSNLKCNMDVFCWDRETDSMFNKKLCELIGLEPRDESLEIKKEYMDLAASIQQRYEEILFEIVKSVEMISDSKNICLSGGCAYNGLANGKILNNTKLKNLWIPLAPSDAGSAIGACINYLVKTKQLKERVTKNPFIGPTYYYNDVIASIQKYKHKKFLSEDKLFLSVAKYLNEGKIIGWFQGHIEFGQRALGNRSILANPFIDGIKDKINYKIKNRESFRPFAPAVTKEKQGEYFEMNGDVPYMNQIVNVKNQYKSLLKEVSNIDGTARVQTVNKNTLLHRLLLEFEKLSGHPILLNTSFNTKDNPIVLTPKKAIQTYLNSEIDILIIGNFIIFKD